MRPASETGVLDDEPDIEAEVEVEAELVDVKDDEN